VSGSARHVSNAELLECFRIANERFDASAPPPNREAFRALFEALAWVGALHDRLKEDQDAQGVPPKRRVFPPTLNGLYYVRNLVLHQGVDVLLQIPGIGPAVLGAAVLGSAVLGGGGGAAVATVFPTLQALPIGQSPVGRDEYETHVASRNVNVTMATAAEEVEATLQ
jgi:hypothetical protein